MDWRKEKPDADGWWLYTWIPEGYSDYVMEASFWDDVYIQMERNKPKYIEEGFWFGPIVEPPKSKGATSEEGSNRWLFSNSPRGLRIIEAWYRRRASRGG